MPAVNRCSSSLARSSSPSSRMVSSTASAAAAAIGLPPNVEPCAPAVSRSAASPKASSRAHRQPAAERLGQGDDVGLRAPSAWCMNQEPVRPMPVCTSSRANSAPASAAAAAADGQVAGRGGQHAALAQHRLEQHHRGLLGDRAGQRLGVPVGHVPHAAGQRREGGGLRRLAGERQRAHRPAVEGALGGDHLGPAGEPADLERRLVGLGAGVAEEDPPGPAGELEQPLGEQQARLVHRQVGDVARACAPAR